MVKKTVTRLKHILESLELIESYLEGKTKEDFITSQQLQDAVIRRMEIIVSFFPNCVFYSTPLTQAYQPDKRNIRTIS